MKSMINETSFAVSGVILAGGKSRRMGRDKAFIEFEGKPLVSRVIERAQILCSETIIVTNSAEAYAPILAQVEGDARIVSDVYPGKGSLGGIYSGLLAAREEYALVLASDLPLLNPALLRYLISLAPSADIVIPRARDLSSKAPRTEEQRRGKTPARAGQRIARQADLHPTHAVYSKNCLPPMQKRLLADDLRVIGVLDDVRVRVVEAAEIDRFDPKHLSLFNANTPEDLRIAQTLRDE